MKVALPPSQLVARLLRDRRQELGLSLRKVSEKLGRRIPSSTLGKIERGEVDPGLPRLVALLEIYDLPRHLATDLVEMEEIASSLPEAADLTGLYETGEAHWLKGDVSKAIACFMAVERRDPVNRDETSIKQKSSHAFAAAAIELGKLGLASHILDNLLSRPAEPELVPRILVSKARIWRDRGNNRMALMFLREARRDPVARDGKERAWILHQESRVRLEMGQLERADRLVDRALAAYRQDDDSYGRARALLLRATIRDKQGNADDALQRLDEALPIAEASRHDRLVAYLRIHRSRLFSRQGRIDEALDDLRAALAAAVVIQDRNAQFLAHYHLWKAYEFTGDTRRARHERESAMHLVQFVDDHGEEATEARALRSREVAE